MLGADRITLLKSKRCEISYEIFLSLIIDLVNDEDDWLVRLAQDAREFLIDRRQTVFRIDQKKQDVAFANGFLNCVSNLGGQFRFARAGDTACVPHNKWLSSARADSRDAIARDPGLVMYDGDAAANQSVKQGGFAYVRPANDRDVRQIILGAVHRQDTGFSVLSRARGLQPATGAHRPLRKPRQTGA